MTTGSLPGKLNMSTLDTPTREYAASWKIVSWHRYSDTSRGLHGLNSSSILCVECNINPIYQAWSIENKIAQVVVGFILIEDYEQ